MKKGRNGKGPAKPLDKAGKRKREEELPEDTLKRAHTTVPCHGSSGS